MTKSKTLQKQLNDLKTEIEVRESYARMGNAITCMFCCFVSESKW